MDATNGGGCGGYGRIGSYDGAVIDLRNRTAAVGGDYVEIVAMVPPHQSGGLCVDDTFAIHGIAYKPGGGSMSHPWWLLFSSTRQAARRWS